jgi:hypothetical protein
MAGATPSQFLASYNTFSGVDIKAVFGSRGVGELQAISVQVTREKAGIYTMGSANPRSFSRGKRGMAGSCIVIQFDRDAILDTLKDLVFQGDIDELRPSATEGNSLEWQLRFSDGRTPTPPAGGGVGPSPTLTQQESELTTVDSDQIVMEPFYADQILPFDITLAAANEYGDIAKMAILGAEFMNEGFGVSIDDLVSEKQYTYLCQGVVWWKWAGPNQRVRELMGG